MRRAGDDIGVGYGAGVNSGRDKAADVRHVDHEVCSDLVRDLAHFLEVDHARICARSGDDELGLALSGCLHSLFVVDHLGLGIDTIEAGVKILSGYRSF